MEKTESDRNRTGKLELLAIHAISRTGDVPLTSGNWEDVRHESAAAVRTTSEAAVSDGLGSRVCVCSTRCTDETKARSTLVYSTLQYQAHRRTEC